MANWRSHAETVQFFGPKIGHFRRFGTTKIRRDFRRVWTVKWHIPSTCLDASRMWLCTGIPESAFSMTEKCHFVQRLRFGVFREGVSQKTPALEGQFLKEIAVRFAGENHLKTQKNTQNKALRGGS